jgi:hypothetical protein
MNRLLTIAAIMALSIGSAAEAKVCTKGKACGDGCIAQADVCHKPAGTATNASGAPVQAGTPAASSTKSTAKKTSASAATPATKPDAAAPAKTTTKSTKAKCKGANGKYAKCGTPGASPA